LSTLFVDDVDELERECQKSAIPTKRDKYGDLSVQCSDATFAYLTSPHQEIEVPLICTCPQRPWPHEIFVHNKMRSEFYQRRFEWPWSLCLSPEAR
jgi:hypothetical protein